MKVNQFLDSTYLKTPSQSGLTEQETILKITQLVKDAIAYHFKLVMIRANYISLARAIISEENSNVLIGTVVGFHEGNSSIEEKLKEATSAIYLGVDELDYVINYIAFKKGNIELVSKEIIACTRLALDYNKIVKWIIEIAALTDNEIASISSLIKKVVIDNFGLEQAQNVFVKSSTGFYKTENNEPNGATFKAIKIMAENGKPLKIKAAGGVKSKQDALKMITLGVDRIGTSSAKQIVGELNVNLEY